jgi:formylmethanofuran dehydrogenase subunit E
MNNNKNIYKKRKLIIKMEKKKITQFKDKKECERCHYFYNEEDMDFYNERMVCRNCEEEMKECERI